MPRVHPRTQSGMALVVGLIILLVMTLIGVAGMRNTTLTERMAGNLHDRNLAFQANEAILREAEVRLQQLMNYPFPYCSGADDPAAPASLPNRFDDLGVRCIRATVKSNNAITQVWQETDNWWANPQNTVSFGEYAALLPRIGALPRVVVEVSPPGTPAGWGLSEGSTGAPPERYASRITARATGGSADAVTMLQSMTHAWDLGS